MTETAGDPLSPEPAAWRGGNKDSSKRLYRTDRDRILARVEYLEEMVRQNLFGWKLLVSLGELQHQANRERESRQILDCAYRHLKCLIQFQALAFYLVDETNSDFVPAFVEPMEAGGRIQDEVDQCIESGLFSWSLKQNHPVTMPCEYFKGSKILHVLATRSRVRGMFVGVVPEHKASIPEPIIYPFSIILQHTAHALESAALYQWIAEQNQNLEKEMAKLKRENVLPKI